MINQKNKKILTLVGIILAIFVIWYLWFGGDQQIKSSFGFSFGAVTKTAKQLKYTVPESDTAKYGDNMIEWGTPGTGTSAPLSIGTTSPAEYDVNSPSVWFGALTSSTTDAEDAKENPLVLLWSGALKTQEGNDLVDGVLFPSGVTLGNDQMKVLNWYLNQDSINAYMSDKQNDGTYTYINNLETTEETENKQKYGNLNLLGELAPYGWKVPYIGLNILDVQSGGMSGNQWSKIANGPNSTSAMGSARTVGFLTAIQAYTELYTYITGIQGSVTPAVYGYGLANISVGNQNGYNSDGVTGSSVNITGPLPSSRTVPKSGISLFYGAGDDNTFYTVTKDSDITAKGIDLTKLKPQYTTYSKKFMFDGPTKHAVWSILLARQNQLLARLDPEIIGKL